MEREKSILPNQLVPSISYNIGDLFEFKSPEQGSTTNDLYLTGLYHY